MDNIILLEGPPGIVNHNILKGYIEENKEVDSNGFCVLGDYNNSQFIHPNVKFIKKYVYHYLLPVIQDIHPSKNIELVLDKVCVTHKGSYQIENHFDVPLSDDVIYEGWINLDPSGSPPQKFYYFPPSSEGVKRQVPINYETMDVKPGNIILYNSNEIIPLDISNMVEKDTYRLVMAWRITDGTKPIFNKLSEDIPPMYTTIHIIDHKKMVFDFVFLVRKLFYQYCKKVFDFVKQKV